MCCSQNCIQGIFFRVHGEICDEDLRGTRDYHECLQIPHDLFQLTFAPSHLLPQSGFAGADNSLRPVRYL
jgi:hypothetical protein